MNIILKSIAIALAFSLMSLPVLGQMGDGKIGEDMMRGKAKEMMNEGKDIREKGGMVGMGFMHSEGRSFGNYVTFSVDNSTGAVLNYGISGSTIFDYINVSGFNFKESATMGSLTRITNKDRSVVIQLHDNPSAVININTISTTSLIFTLAQGVTATKEDKLINISADNITAFIVAGNATSINIAAREIRIEATKGNIIFRAAPVNVPVLNRKFMGEMMKNRAGAEISVGMQDKSSIVNYSEDINVMIRSIERDRMRMTINSQDHSGKFIMMDIDNTSMMWNERQMIRLYLDNKSLRQVMSEQELYDATESSFWLNMMGKNRMQAVMYIANFSERQVDIVVEDNITSTATPGSTSTTTPEVTKTEVSATPKTPGFEVMIGLLGTAVAYRMRRKQ
ncbi:MAG: hypothetical protein OIN87_04930 [Candidatus Methanoperedens sp.]|nr:hypothetical protein [Candidatus Methanoperedens sp.]